VPSQVVRRELDVADSELFRGWPSASVRRTVGAELTRVEGGLQRRKSVVLQHVQEGLAVSSVRGGQ
jgi:hypothetical protein